MFITDYKLSASRKRKRLQPYTKPHIERKQKGTESMKQEGQVRIPSGCAIAAVISKEGKKMSGQAIIESMKPMHDRSNGLGGGFAGYGIYPQYKDYYAFHLFFDCRDTRKACEAFLKEHFEVVKGELIPTH